MAAQTAEPGAVEGERTEGGETGLGLEPNVAGALAYVLGVLTGALVYLTEPDDAFVRFHAAQSMVVSIGLVAVWMGFGILGGVLGAVGAATGGVFVFAVLGPVLALVWGVLSLASFGLWVYLIVSAYRGRSPRVPVAARLADRLV
jgi:uncharacterized membrane protein